MKQRVLVPLNCTEMGEAVLPQLESFIMNSSPCQDAEITLLHVLPVINFNVLTTDERAQLSYAEDESNELYRSAYFYLDEIASRLRSKGFRVATRVRMGRAGEEIVKLANEINANLIAMSTHGRAGIIRWVKGSITDKVISMENKIPILMVHVGTKRKESSLFSFRSVQTILKYI